MPVKLVQLGLLVLMLLLLGMINLGMLLELLPGITLLLGMIPCCLGWFCLLSLLFN